MITNNYIKMCEQAEEIQAQWRKPFKNYIGDLYWQGERYLMIPEACICVTEIMFNPKDEHKWLPTQEQSQEMVLTKNILENTWSLGWLINNIYRFSENKYEYEELPKHYAFKNFTETTELWLAFVMYKKWNKIWTGKKWVLNE